MSSRDVTILGYLVLVAAVVVIQIVSRRPRSPVPSIGQILDAVMASRAGRVALIAGWAWLGLHFFAR